MGRRLVFLGPPGAGKGTQAAMLCRAIGIPHVSTGAILRQAVADETDLGKRAAEIMAAGDLVPDDLVTSVVVERLARDDAACGFLLDGYPRTAAQAEALEDALGEDGIETAILLAAPEEELVGRLLGRAREEGRSDDNEDTIRRRLEVYREDTAPLADHYRKLGVLMEVDGVGSVDDVFARIVLALAT